MTIYRKCTEDKRNRDYYSGYLITLPNELNKKEIRSLQNYISSVHVTSSSFGSTTVVGQYLTVPLAGLAYNDFWITPYSRIVSPTYGGMVYLGLEPMADMLLKRTS